jgi:transposase-like protein
MDGNQIFDPDDAGLTNEETATILGVKPETLATWRSQGRGPRFRKTGRRVEYTPKFIKEYQAACIRTPEAAAARRQRSALNIDAA